MSYYGRAGAYMMRLIYARAHAHRQTSRRRRDAHYLFLLDEMISTTRLIDTPALIAFSSMPMIYVSRAARTHAGGRCLRDARRLPYADEAFRRLFRERCRLPAGDLQQ